MFGGSTGKTSVSAKIGAIIRQSRKLSRTSRRVTMRALLSVSPRVCSPRRGSTASLTSMVFAVVAMLVTSLRLLVFFDNLQINFFQALLDLAQRDDLDAVLG